MILSGADKSILCVDLDGSLLCTDLLAESLLLLVKRNPLYVFMLPVWLLRGRSRLKREIATRVKLDPSLLPYHAELLAWLRSERRNGRRIVAATSSDRALASSVGEYLDLFERVHASDGFENLKGLKKSEVLVESYGTGNFAYVGNSRADLPVWKKAQGAILVGVSPAVAAEVAMSTPIEREFMPTSRVSAGMLWRATRVHQWVKNLLVFVPVVTAHHLTNFGSIGAASRAFAALCLASAAIYIANDLFDLEADRRHTTKHARPFASGRASIWIGIMLAPVLTIGAIAVGLSLPSNFLMWLIFYVVATMAYSLRLKHIAIVDVLVLAILYTVRLIAGAAAIEVPVSAWLLAFSLFFFLSLALLKRFSEIDMTWRQTDGPEFVRGYLLTDREMVGQFGAISGYLSILVMALYINSREVAVLYSTPAWLWGFCPLLLYWISRIWLSAHRGELHEDPVVFAMRHVSSYVVLGGLGMFMYLAI